MNAIMEGSGFQIRGSGKVLVGRGMLVTADAMRHILSSSSPPQRLEGLYMPSGSKCVVFTIDLYRSGGMRDM